MKQKSLQLKDAREKADLALLNQPVIRPIETANLTDMENLAAFGSSGVSSLKSGVSSDNL